MKLDPTDRKMIEEVLAEEREDDTRFHGSVFRGWLERDVALSAKQRKWLRDVAERVLGTPFYENLASSGTLARGREVASMVGSLPLKPPGRA